MLVDDLLQEAGLPYAEVAFNNPPMETYAIYNQEIERRGADAFNCLTELDISIEVYSYDFFDGDAVRALARAMDRRGLDFKQYDTMYINSEHLYCTRFEFSHVEKDQLEMWLDRYGY